MDIRNEFNRIGNLFNGGLEKPQSTTGHWVQTGTRRANKAVRQARRRLDAGTRNIVGVEESIVRHLRENPALYVIGAAVLMGLLIAKLVIEARQARDAPLL